MIDPTAIILAVLILNGILARLELYMIRDIILFHEPIKIISVIAFKRLSSPMMDC